MKRLQKRRNSEAQPRQEAPSAPSALMGGMPSLTEGAGRKDLPEAMRQKMEYAFGADFSNVAIYESEKVAEGGAKAVTRGNTIAFAPGEFNPYSPHSEALLGHELSHVVSQARGESRGNGFLDNACLEARADREGVMAAAGQQVNSGPVTPISASSPASVSGPMQCKRGDKKASRQNAQADEIQAELYGAPAGQQDDFADWEIMEKPRPDGMQGEEQRMRRLHAKPWELTDGDFKDNQFNPNQDKRLQEFQDRVDAAKDPREVYSLFTGYCGSSDKNEAELQDDDDDNPAIDKMDLDVFKKRIKNMGRVIRDYPELGHMIGHMYVEEYQTRNAGNGIGGGGSMATNLRSDGDFNDKMFMDYRVGNAAEHPVGQDNWLTADETYTGVHEMGHVANTYLSKQRALKKNQNYGDYVDDFANDRTANSVVKKVLDKTLTKEQKKKVVNFDRERVSLSGKKVRGNKFKHIDLSKSHLGSDITSGYVTSEIGNAGEFFAEAFADVYAHGRDARPASIELVKEYERRRDKYNGQIQENFGKNKKK